jgi:hypothetical protein
MKVNFKEHLIDCNGIEKENTLDEQLRLMFFSLDSTKDLVVSEKEKYLSYQIGRRLLEGDGSIELTIEEAAFFKSKCAFFLGAYGYGRVVDLLENNNQTNNYGNYKG